MQQLMRSASCKVGLEGSEAERDQRVEELEHCLHALAHDLRSPLVSMLGFARLLRQEYGPQLDDTALHFVDRIEQAGLTMESLLEELLDFARIGRGPEARSLVDPQPVLRQLQAELKPCLEAKGTRLELPEEVPLVYCARTRLYQVLSNLVRNALDHMGECSAPVIRVSIRDEGDAHRISVSDNGRGVLPAERERIFELFQQGTGGARRGSGLGLAIVRKIAATHGGRAWVESEPGAGCHFHVTLPKR